MVNVGDIKGLVCFEFDLTSAYSNSRRKSQPATSSILLTIWLSTRNGIVQHGGFSNGLDENLAENMQIASLVS